MKDLVQRLRDEAPKVGEPENVWCSVHAKDLREAVDLIEAQAAEIAKLTAENGALAGELHRANITLRGRAHPASEPRDSPECLRTLGFWPDCGCGECYAIHCLDNAMAERDALRADAERYRWLRQHGNSFFNAVNYQGKNEVLDAAIDAALAARAQEKKDE